MLKSKKISITGINKKQVNKMENKGLTLIEMLVAITMFSIIMGAVSGLFISAVRSQRRVLVAQEMIDQTGYVMEYMSRAIRMAQKQLPPTVDCSTTCLSQDGLNYELIGEDDLRFRNSKCICQRFFLDAGQLKEQEEWVLSGGVPTGGTENSLTSDDFQINPLKFNISGEEEIDTFQPRATISLKIESTKVSPSPKLQIQTSISQRPLDTAQ
jgi:prepilin-type N-terminal cleavage/methylation domain-containing protein